MRVVVIGASGNVGTSLVQVLGDEPEVTSVLGLARRVPDWVAPKTEWAPADIASDDLVPHLRGADAVVNLAWLIQPTHSPLVTWRANVLGGLRVMRAVAEVGVPVFAQASSVGAYSPGEGDRPVDENWPTHGWPTASYCREKAYLERLLDRFEQETPACRVVRMRPAFTFKREAATGQRRLFLGPLLPGALLRPGVIPALPELSDLRFQALHSDDAADAYRLAIIRDVRGPFNLAADPVVDMASVAPLLRARTIPLRSSPVRTLLAAAWRLRLTPAAPHLLDALLRLPRMDTTRARTELGWIPQYSALDAVGEFLDGLATGAGLDTPPLSPQTSGPARLREFATGVGHRP
jgi:UDP-glucose 4-epimerase